MLNFQCSTDVLLSANPCMKKDFPQRRKGAKNAKDIFLSGSPFADHLQNRNQWAVDNVQHPCIADPAFGGMTV